MAAPRVHAVVPAWSPPVWSAFIAALTRFEPGTRDRGRRYAQQGRVSWLEVFDDAVQATVEGDASYDVAWKHSSGAWHSRCSCPVMFFCKHAYAVACLLVGDDASPKAAKAAPTPGRRTSPDLVQLLLEARGPWERQHAIGRLLPRDWPHGLWPFEDLLGEPHPEILCWRLAHAIAARTGGALPRALEPFRDRPELAARVADRDRAELLRDVMGWAGRLRRTATRSLRVVLTLGLDATGAAIVQAEARLTSSKLVDAPRTMQQLHGLRSQLQQDLALLPPDQAALLVWLTDHGVAGRETWYTPGAVISTAALPRLLEQVADTTLAAWGDALPADLATRAGVAPGDPVRLSPAPARLVPTCVSRDDDTTLAFHFVWPDGRTCSMDEALYIPRPDSSLVLRDGVFSTVAVAPPGHIVTRLQTSRGLRLRPDERVTVLRRLADGFPHLREDLAAHTRVHAVTPVVTLDLGDDDRLSLRLFAHTGGWRPGAEPAEGSMVFELTREEGWTTVRGTSSASAAYEPLGAEAAAARVVTTLPAVADPWLDEPDPACVAPVTAWLTHCLGASPASRPPAAPVPGWALAVRRRMDAFAEAWAARPPGVVFYGTPRIRRLLDGERRVASRLRLEASGIDWFSVSAEWEAEGLSLTDADLAALRAATTRFVKLPGGDWIDREAAVHHDDAATVLADLGIEAGGGPQRLTLWQLAGARPESLAALERLGADAETLRAVAELRRRVAAFRGLSAVAPPPELRATLRPYQQRGLDFLAHAADLGVGAILADDMGLGKTVQALAWLAHLRAVDPDGGPTLVVCPASVVHNWAREAERFAPHLRVLLLTRGSGRHALRDAIAEHDLVVTNYALLRHDAEAWRKVRLRALILDEAQNVKNPDAAVTRVVSALETRHRLALTGTPLENRPLDLWSIMSCVNPGYLGTRRDFSARYDRLDVPAHRRTLLAARLRPVLLRRLKREVAPELPERVEERLDCELTPGQRRLYLAELARSRRLVEQLSDGPGGLRQHRIDVLAALTRLRQICCHPALARGKAGLGSGKFDALFDLLEPLLAEGHKVLVFSQFVECLKLLATEMRGRAIPHHVLTGQTVKREAVVTAFTDDAEPCVFLVSLKAGGTGLNLTAASYVVLFDPWWNPAVEAQAIDRTHRIGQDRTVIAYRLVARGTVEERIFEMQQRKAALARDVLGEGGFGRALTRQDLGYLLAAEDGDEVPDSRS